LFFIVSGKEAMKNNEILTLTLTLTLNLALTLTPEPLDFRV